MPNDYWRDERVVLTLDAGGTYFRFSATCANCRAGPVITEQSCAGSLSECLQSITTGLKAVRGAAPQPPVRDQFWISWSGRLSERRYRRSATSAGISRGRSVGRLA